MSRLRSQMAPGVADNPLAVVHGSETHFRILVFGLIHPRETAVA
jgi:hypothetical protein